MKEIDEDGYALRPNKTQIKKEIESLRTLAEKMLELPVAKFERLTVSDELAQAIVAARKMKKGAMQRQLRFIVGILKNYDDEDVLKIQKQYEVMMLPQQQANASLHQLESWRDRLIQGDDELINELVNNYAADRQHMRQLVRNIQKEQKKQAELHASAEKGEAQRLPKAGRVLFKYLQDLMINHEG